MIAVQFMKVSRVEAGALHPAAVSILLVVDPEDERRGEDDPQELVPIEERNSPKDRFDRIVERDPEQGDEGDE
jgi:hypothetical protein